MKRATITFPDELERKLEAYLKRQAAPPSLSSLVQTALDEYLEHQKWREREYRPPESVLTLPISNAEAVEPEVSAEHDRYLAEMSLVRKAGKD
jgi:metal-responsive CopG/Arc/MetJ family transcriptional regulator